MRKKIVSFKDKRFVKCMIGAIERPCTLSTIPALLEIPKLLPHQPKPETIEEKALREQKEQAEKMQAELAKEQAKAELLAEAMKNALRNTASSD